MLTGVDWWKKAVFYQIYPRSFKDSNGDGIGDLPGIIEKLDYLNDGTPGSLGIDAIWFSPFFKSPEYDFGYDIADYCDIDPRFGTLADFDRLVAEAHRRGIRVMLDLVVNHSSHEHPWFRESRSSRENPKRDWYIWRDGVGPRRRPPNNWRNNFFGPAWTWDENTEQYYLHSFLPQQPDLNWFNPEVRRAIEGVVRFWLERGADGFRLDVAHIYCKDEQFRSNPPFFRRTRVDQKMPYGDRELLMNLFHILGLPEFQVKKYNQHHPETHRVLKEFRQVLDEYPEKTSIGEVLSEDPQVVASYYGSGNDELHMNFYFDMTHCRWKAGAFRRCVERWERLLPAEAWPAYTFSNHDIVRAISRYGGDGHADARARLLAMMLLTLRGTPFIYYGEEIGMNELRLPRRLLKDPVGKKWYPFHRGRDGCRSPMQWDESPGAGFTTGEPWLPVGPEAAQRNVAAQEEDPASLLNFYRKLIWLRKEQPALLGGSYRSVVEGVPGDCYLYLRETEEQRLLVALNFSASRRDINLPPRLQPARLLISTDPHRAAGELDRMPQLGPYEGCLIHLNS
ncbi:MAG TPA: alpha-glucosidase [Bacillota bacterium]|nr:alpha-glucosidase [Bacillota bacterium]